MSKLTKIWDEAHLIARDIAEANGFLMSDIISSIFLEALQNPSIVFAALTKFFEIEEKEALKLSYAISEDTKVLLKQWVWMKEEKEAVNYAQRGD